MMLANPIEHQRQHHLRYRVAAVVPGASHLPCKEMAELQHSRTYVKEVDSSEMRQTSMITGDSKISKWLSHSGIY